MIGIYGGTFNPVHYGHLRSAWEVTEIFQLSQMRLIPCYQPVLKQQPAVSAAVRLQMLQLAVENQPRFVCDSRELERQGPSYMVDTLASLRTDFPGQPLLLFIGSDAFAGLSRWYQWQRLFDYAHIVVMSRPSSQLPALDDFLVNRLTTDKTRLRQTLCGQLFFQDITQLDISATAIRDLIAIGRNPVFLLPDNVINYIKKYQLYRNLNAD